MHVEGDTTEIENNSDDPFKDQIITHKRRYYNETENNTLPEHCIWKGL